MRAYAKAIVAIISTTLGCAATIWTDSPWIALATVFVTSVGVYLIPNLPAGMPSK